MRRALFALSVVAVAALPQAASAHHTCLEISGAINTEPYLGDCQYDAGPHHVCQMLKTESLTIVVCIGTLAP